MNRSVQLEVVDVDVQVGDKAICRQLDLRLSEGQVWALLGENGVGKSTLMATLAGARNPQRGEVLLDGRSIVRRSPRDRAHRLGWLTQRDDDYFPSTVMEKVLVGRHPFLNRMAWESTEDEVIARDALNAVGLQGFESRDVTTLSGGERRRVGIAALLAQQTPLLLLDEPLAQLDIRHQLDVLRLLADLAQRDHGVMMITHDPNHAIRFATHVLLLFGDGRTMAGRVDDILTASNVSALYRCPVREVMAGSERYFFPMEEEPIVISNKIWRTR